MRTIVFSLSSQPVFKNFFLFPGGLFDRIKEGLHRDQDLRIVFVIPRDQLRKYASLFEGMIGAQCAVEGVEVAKPQFFAARVFRFFYSYLVYTSTTRLLATMGTRPDEMPPGSRFLAPLKFFIAATFGRMRFVRTRAVPFLFARVFPARPFARVLDDYRPERIFAPNLYGWFDTLLAREARERGIETVGMTAGWDHIDKYFMPFQCDRLLAQNEHIRRAAIKEQDYDPDRVAVVGYPHFDFISGQHWLKAREEVLRACGFPPDAKFILYISGSVYCPDEPDVIERMTQWAEEGKFSADTYLALRPYLVGRLKDRDFDERKFASFSRNPRVYLYQRESWSDLLNTVYLLNLMAHADAVVSAFSTAALEVAVLDRPLIAVGFDGYKTRPLHRSVRRFELFTHFQDIFTSGAIRMTRNFSELFAALDGYLKNPALDADRRALLRSRMRAPLDGNASGRVFDAVFSLPAREDHP